MTSIICPKCKSHITMWELNCLNCGLAITEELREKLIKEQQKQNSAPSFKESSPKEEALKRHKKYVFQKRLNKFSLGLFKIGFAEMVVPLSIVALVIIVIILMLL